MFLVFDIGGTNMRMATSPDGENFHGFKVCDTPQDYDSALKIIKDFSSDAGLTGVGDKSCFGLAGVLNADRKSLFYAPNLKDWEGKPVEKDLSAILNCNVELHNDASLAGLGEVTRGVGRHHEIVAYITVGTGVGGVRLVGGKVDISSIGFEPGHHIFDLKLSGDDGYSDWEAFVGGTSLKKKYLLDAENIKDKNIWNEVNRYLAIGLINTIVFWSPALIILGGSVAQNENVSVDLISEDIKKNLKTFPMLPEIKKGILGNKAALYGGLEVLKQSN